MHSGKLYMSLILNKHAGPMVVMTIMLRTG